MAKRRLKPTQSEPLNINVLPPQYHFLVILSHLTTTSVILLSFSKAMMLDVLFNFQNHDY